MIVQEYDRCELCGEPMPDEYQTATFMVKAGYATAHKSCLFQLMLGAWDELAWRSHKGVAPNAPYTRENITDPYVRKAVEHRYKGNDTESLVQVIMEGKDELVSNGTWTEQDAESVTPETVEKYLDYQALRHGAMSKAVSTKGGYVHGKEYDYPSEEIDIYELGSN